MALTCADLNGYKSARSLAPSVMGIGVDRQSLSLSIPPTELHLLLKTPEPSLWICTSLPISLFSSPKSRVKPCSSLELCLSHMTWLAMTLCAPAWAATWSLAAPTAQPRSASEYLTSSVCSRRHRESDSMIPRTGTAGGARTPNIWSRHAPIPLVHTRPPRARRLRDKAAADRTGLRRGLRLSLHPGPRPRSTLHSGPLRVAI